ncbi:hypothetical protein [Lacihabitans soyangensis]|jgi:hypothetical protein|uniref:DUF975 family protein n=1 Tax=Lacihabitans soyangensis TaxID=869394 RepID=A0AAE3KT07_9BACT|nr:hypothetical protein [Lacihabitans soyangensis]MCP9761781.1 hypothetical protein [Lacihabitans soyangensis]
MSQKLTSSLASGYEVKIGDYISRGYEIFKANMGAYIGYTVLYFLITTVVNMIPFLNIISSLVISPCLVFGFYLVSKQISQENTLPTFNTFFGGFNYAGKIIVISLITMLVFVVCMMPFLISVGVSIFALRDSDSSEIISAILAGPLPILGVGLLVMVYFAVSWCFASLIAVFHNKESWAAMEISRKLVGKNWFMMLLFLIVVGVVTAAGFLLLGIGIIFTLPLGICSLYAAFEDICGLPEDGKVSDEISQIGEGI